MRQVLPQQRLLLELLVMSGEIAVPTDAEGTILWRTLCECRDAGWLRQTKLGADILKIEITPTGRHAVKQVG